MTRAKVFLPLAWKTSFLGSDESNRIMKVPTGTRKKLDRISQNRNYNFSLELFLRSIRFLDDKVYQPQSSSKRPYKYNEQKGFVPAAFEMHKETTLVSILLPQLSLDKGNGCNKIVDENIISEKAWTNWIMIIRYKNIKLYVYDNVHVFHQNKRGLCSS